MADNPRLTYIYERELKVREKAFEAGIVAALYDAILICLEADLPSPKWVQIGTARLMKEMFSGGLERKKGRTGNPFARYRNDMIHYARWDAVMDARVLRAALSPVVFVGRQYPEFSEKEEKDKQQLKANLSTWVKGMTWQDAYEGAANMLKGTPASGAPATMKNSYIKVNKASKDPSKAHRYIILSRRTLRLLGIKL